MTGTCQHMSAFPPSKADIVNTLVLRDLILLLLTLLVLRDCFCNTSGTERFYVTQGWRSAVHEAVRRPLRPSQHRSVPRRRRSSAEGHKRDAPATSREGGGVQCTGQPSAVVRRRSAPRPRQVQRFAQPSAVAVNVVCGRQSAWSAGAVPGAVCASTRELQRRSRCRRSRAPPQECVGRSQRVAPPWHALMAISRAPNV